MTSILNNLLRISFLIALMATCATAQAQTGQQLSVSPTLFDMRANPGQEWRSSIRIVNANSYELTVYVNVVNFAPRGEGGDGMLLPVLEGESDGLTLAEWVDYERGAIVIPPEKTYEMPFTVRIPESAAPGGHYAAFMVGTKPPKDDGVSASQLRTSQVVTSLFFARISGDVIESGMIREFRTTKRIYGRPEANFELRFENKGNVHLRPQGDILITNMWGQERGTIPINRHAHFGNVLSQSTRKFDFSWKSDWSFSDVGRYKAIVTLAYGQDAQQFVTSTTYFWVLPLGLLAAVLGGIAVTVLGITFLIRLYVRRMLRMAGVDERSSRQPYRRKVTKSDLLLVGPVNTSDSTSIPVPHDPLGDRQHYYDRFLTVMRWLRTKNKWLLFAVGAVLLLILLLLVLRLVSEPKRSYEVTYTSTGASTSITSDQIDYDDKRADIAAISTVAASGTPILIVNRSGKAGVAAEVALTLESQGYSITEVRTDLEETQGKTVIVYSPNDTDAALELSAKLNSALLSAYAENEEKEHITVYIGADLAKTEQ